MCLICPLVCAVRRQIYTAVMQDSGFTACVLDLAHTMLLTAGGPLWQQFQRPDITTAER